MSQTATELYQRAVLDHNKSPRYYGELVGATHTATGHNPICGDVVHVAFSLDGNHVQAMQFTAQSCALCKASASIMCDAMQGQSIAAVQFMAIQFIKMLNGEPISFGAEMDVLAAVKDFPARAKCVLLPWRTLKGALESKPGADVKVTTES